MEQNEKAKSKDEKKNLIDNKALKLSDEELGMVAGGGKNGTDYPGAKKFFADIDKVKN